MTEPTPDKPKAKKATAAKPEFAPKVTEKGRLDHSDCGHERTLVGRSACRANHKAAQESAAK